MTLLRDLCLQSGLFAIHRPICPVLDSQQIPPKAILSDNKMRVQVSPMLRAGGRQPQRADIVVAAYASEVRDGEVPLKGNLKLPSGTTGARRFGFRKIGAQSA